MKSVAGLGLGILALTAGAFITAGVAAGVGKSPATTTRASHFAASVEGGISARPAGEVAFGVVGDSGSEVAAFTITLGGQDSSGAILFTSLEGRTPAPGRYELSDTGSTGFRAMYVAGSAERPAGLFRAERGTLEITAASTDHVSGHFTFIAGGFLASDPWDTGSEVKVGGAFRSTRAPAGEPAQP